MKQQQNSRPSNNNTGTLLGGLLGALILAATPIAPAAVVVWDGGGDGSSFGTSKGGANLNWDGDVTPSDQDDITINPSTSTTVNYNTAIFPTPASSTTGPRTMTIGNSGAGTTTLNVTADLYTRISNLAGIKAVTINSGGVWKQTAGTSYHNDHVLIDGGGLLVEGGLFTAGAWPSGNPLIVTNGGTINVTGGEVRWTTGVPHILGQTGTASLTLGSGATPSNGAGFLQVGNGTTGAGTVIWNATANGANAMRQLDLQNGSVTINADAGMIFLSTGRGSRANIEVGTSTGTAVLNKYNSAILGGDRDAISLELLRVGANGTVNWADGDMYSNVSDNKVINGGVWNFTRASGSSYFRFGPIFENDGTFNWTGGATMNLNPGGVQGAGDFQNDGVLVMLNDGQVTLLGDLILSASGTFDVGLGTQTTTGLLAGGTNGGAITLGGALEFSELAGFQKLTNYDILRGTLTGSFASIDARIYVVDNGSQDGTFTIQIIPEPTSFGLLALGALALARRRR